MSTPVSNPVSTPVSTPVTTLGVPWEFSCEYPVSTREYQVMQHPRLGCRPHPPTRTAPSARRLSIPTSGRGVRVVLQVGMGLSGNGCKWESKARARAAQWTARKRRQQTPTRRLAHRLPKRALALDPSGRVFVGNTTFLVALAAGLGGACFLVVVILVIIRSRRARATGPAPGLRTLLVGE